MKPLRILCVFTLAASLLLPSTAQAFPHTAFTDSELWNQATQLTENQLYGFVAGGPFAWAHPYIRDAAAWELVMGYPEGSTEVDLLGATKVWDKSPTFSPGGTITRAEFAAILARVTGFEHEYTSDIDLVFRDIPREEWFAPYLGVLVKREIVRPTDYDRDLLRPNEPITRAEMAVWLARSVGAHGVTLVGAPLPFADIDADYPFREELSQAVSLGIIKGYPDGTFRPMATANRAEAATMLVRLVPTLTTQSGPPSQGEIFSVAQEALDAYARALHTVAHTQASPPGNRVDEAKIRKDLSKWFTSTAIGPFYEDRTQYGSPRGQSAAGWFWSRSHSLIGEMYGFPAAVKTWLGEATLTDPELLLASDRYAILEITLTTRPEDARFGLSTRATRERVSLYFVKVGSNWKVSGINRDG